MTIADPEQVVLESEPVPPARLHVAHLHAGVGRSAITTTTRNLEQFAAEPRSTVTFDIEPQGEMVKLTVVHDGFDPGSGVLPAISQGWPAVMPASRRCSKPASPSPWANEASSRRCGCPGACTGAEPRR